MSSSKPPDKFWRQEDPILSDAGLVVTGGMWEHQRAWWSMPNRIKLLVGGYGSGKSLVLCKRAISTALANAPAPTLIVSPTYPMAHDIIVRTMVPMLDGKVLERVKNHKTPLLWSMHKGRLDVTLACNGKVGTILVRSGDNPDRLKGPNLGAVYLDEPFIMQKAVLDQALARVRHPRARIREIGLCGTPEQLNFGYDLAEGDLRVKYDVGVVRAPTRANLALPSDYITGLENAYTDKMRAAYLEGQFVNMATGLVYYAFDVERNVRDLPVPDGAQLFCGMDFNVNPMAFCVGWLVQAENHAHIFWEREEPNSSTPDACAILRSQPWGTSLGDIYPDPSGVHRVTAAAGVSDFKSIRDAGFTAHAPRQAPLRRDRFNAVNMALAAGRLTISPSCTKLKRYMLNYTHENEHKKDHKAMGHLLDAVGYPIIWHFPVERPSFVNVPA